MFDLRFGYMYARANHEAAVNDETQSKGVERECCTLERRAKRQILQCPALRDAIRHEADLRKRCRNWSALEISRLSGLIFRKVLDRDVETC